MNIWSGSGIPNVFRVWHDNGFPEPVFSETYEPARITLTLQISNVSDLNRTNKKASDKKASDKKTSDKKASDKKASDKKASDKKASDKKTSDKKQAIKDNRIAAMQAETVMDYLTGHPTAKTKDIAVRLKVSDPRARAILARLVEKEVLIAEGSNRDWKI